MCESEAKFYSYLSAPLGEEKQIHVRSANLIWFFQNVQYSENLGKFRAAVQLLHWSSKETLPYQNVVWRAAKLSHSVPGLHLLSIS